jgi:hypothetical protein
VAQSVVEVPVDEVSARRYVSLSLEDRGRFHEIVRLLLEEGSGAGRESSVEIAREGGRVAASNGMTQEILDELLRD